MGLNGIALTSDYNDCPDDFQHVSKLFLMAPDLDYGQIRKDFRHVPKLVLYTQTIEFTKSEPVGNT